MDQKKILACLLVYLIELNQSSYADPIKKWQNITDFEAEYDPSDCTSDCTSDCWDCCIYYWGLVEPTTTEYPVSCETCETCPPPTTCEDFTTCQPCETVEPCTDPTTPEPCPEYTTKPEPTCPPCEFTTAEPDCPTYEPPTTESCPEPTTPDPTTCPPWECPTCPTEPPATECPTFPPCETQPPCEECPTCPTIPTIPTTPSTTTCAPSIDVGVKFSKVLYQGSLASWPIAGHILHLGINATTENNDLIQYSLISSFEFLTLSTSQDIIFTSNVEEGAFVGPNNVMLIEVKAEVVGQDWKTANAGIAIIFPRPRYARNQTEENVL